MPERRHFYRLPSFLQERVLAFSTQTVGLIRTVVIVCPFLDALDRESCHLAPLLCHGHGGGKTSIGTTMFGPLARWHLDETASQGATKRSSLIEGSRCPLLREPLQHSARYEIKDFQGALLS
jgi:hypothetical protein